MNPPYQTYLYMLPGCLLTFFMIIFTVCFLYHNKASACCRKRPLPEASPNKPPQSLEMSPKQQCSEVLPSTMQPYSKTKEPESPTSYEGNSPEHIELQEISPFTEISVIARTKKNKVWLGRDSDGEHFAVKCMYNEASFEREALINRSLSHENILCFIRAYRYNLDSCLVFQYHGKGNLWKFLTTSPLIEFDNALNMAISLTHGLNYLHNIAFVAHRDIKSQNVLVKSDDTLCLCDFGLAVRRAGDNHVDLISINKFVGTRRYMSPEILEERMDFDVFSEYKMADVYSFSYVLWELFHCTTEKYLAPLERYVPPGPTVTSMREIVCRKNIRPFIPPGWHENELYQSIIDLLGKSWTAVPRDRLSVESVLSILKCLLN